MKHRAFCGCSYRTNPIVFGQWTGGVSELCQRHDGGIADPPPHELIMNQQAEYITALVERRDYWVKDSLKRASLAEQHLGRVRELEAQLKEIDEIPSSPVGS